MARTNRMVAHTALAHKLARASYYIMRDNVEFDNKKLFAWGLAGKVNQCWGWLNHQVWLAAVPPLISFFYCPWREPAGVG